jgi:DNA-directed RNA polymerase
MDFRGRAYPCTPHLSNVGSDLCRGMLKFAEAKPLGPRGLYWLKVHLANFAGKDKVSFDARASFVDEMMDKVRESVEDPFAGEQWWMTLEDPFQGLATCYEIVDAIDSGDPESFMCSLPVHMDGSCNGLQHYAALGRDLVGGKAVNLCALDAPQDVYSGVMREVIRRVAEEASTTLDFDTSDVDSLNKKEKKSLGNNRAAKLVNGLIDRGVVKRTVMTSVYGKLVYLRCCSICMPCQALSYASVDYIRDVARRDLHRGQTANSRKNRVESKYLFVEEELNGMIYACLTHYRHRRHRILQLEEKGHDIDEMNLEIFRACGYLARVTMDVMGELFTGAKETMNWLTTCARLISEHEYPVAWVSPIGLPAIQPYRLKKPATLLTLMQTVTLVEESDDLPLHRGRQVTAFPPNYVHSLDSSHMLFTALEMDRRGLTFSAVHDSFWTHACDIDEMNAVLRDTFVELYTQPLLEKQKESWEMRYPEIHFPDLPERGKLDLNEVKSAKYFFQ